MEYAYLYSYMSRTKTKIEVEFRENGVILHNVVQIQCNDIIERDTHNCNRNYIVIEVCIPNYLVKVKELSTISNISVYDFDEAELNKLLSSCSIYILFDLISQINYQKYRNLLDGNALGFLIPNFLNNYLSHLRIQLSLKENIELFSIVNNVLIRGSLLGKLLIHCGTVKSGTYCQITAKNISDALATCIFVDFEKYLTDPDIETKIKIRIINERTLKNNHTFINGIIKYKLLLLLTLLDDSNTFDFSLMNDNIRNIFDVFNLNNIYTLETVRSKHIYIYEELRKILALNPQFIAKIEANKHKRLESYLNYLPCVVFNNSTIDLDMGLTLMSLEAFPYFWYTKVNNFEPNKISDLHSSLGKAQEYIIKLYADSILNYKEYSLEKLKERKNIPTADYVLLDKKHKLEIVFESKFNFGKGFDNGVNEPSSYEKANTQLKNVQARSGYTIIYRTIVSFEEFIGYGMSNISLESFMMFISFISIYGIKNSMTILYNMINHINEDKEFNKKAIEKARNAVMSWVIKSLKEKIDEKISKFGLIGI